MTDPIRRDPTEFLRVLKRMATSTSWQKTMLFASKGRMVGYRLTLDHYNTVLFSQSIWGRALEMIRVIRSMNEDDVQMNGASYYYICNGMANVEHGWNYDFQVNFRLPRLQHWRVAIDALAACEYNGFDATDTMYNSTLIACVIPGINRWEQASKVLHKMLEDDRKMHPNMVKFYHDCLIRKWRPREASELLRLAARQRVEGYEAGGDVDVYKPIEESRKKQAALLRAVLKAKQRQKALGMSGAKSKGIDKLSAVAAEEEIRKMQESEDELRAQSQRAVPLTEEEEKAIEAEKNAVVPFSSGLHVTEQNSVFRPRVYRQLWYRWHEIANKYRPNSTLKKRQLAPRDSPTGIPAFFRL